MKHQLSILTFVLVIFAAVAISTYAQNGNKENKGKGNKEQGNNQDKGQGKNKDKGNNSNDNSNKDNGKGRDNKDKQNNGNGNSDKAKGENGGKDDNRGRYKMKDGFKWDDETFRDRDRFLKNQQKVAVCHKTNGNDEPAVTIRVSENAVKAHMNHGDVMGECTGVDNGAFSDIFIRRRADYYNTLQDSYEQVNYSRSIIDYALERLTGARSQLVVLQNNNAPSEDIERKRLLIVDLEENVSLLQTLIGVTANLVASKLMN